MTKVSIIVPVYNVAKYLRQCMDSLVGQTLREIEVICVDDGSTDGSGAILDEYAVNDARIKVIHQVNTGAGAARNAGFALAQGEYLFFCDPDDWCDRRMFARLSARAKRMRADIVLSPVFFCDAETGRTVRVWKPGRRPRVPVAGADLGDRLFRFSRHTIWDKLFRRQFVLENDISFQAIRRFNDMLFCDLSLACAERIVYAAVPGYHHRVARSGGLQTGRIHTPELALKPYEELRKALEARGTFEPFRDAYKEAYVSQTLRLLFMLNDPMAFTAFYNDIVMGWAGLGPLSAASRRALAREVPTRVFNPDLTATAFATAVACAYAEESRRRTQPCPLSEIVAWCKSRIPFGLKARW